MASGIVNTIKQAAVEAVESSKPVAVMFGTVKKVSPLEIMVNPNLMLNSNVLTLTRQVTDYSVNVTLDNWKTELNEPSVVTEHFHDIIGNKKITVHNGLKLNDTVIMLRVQGGQKYVVLDKVG